MTDTSGNQVGIVDYDDLQKKETCPSLKMVFDDSFGKNGIGLIAVRNVPGFVEGKTKLLPMAHKLVNLPSRYLEEELADEKSLYNSGWSLGKEKLGDGEPDFSKGSFYYNPCSDMPGTEEDRKAYPFSYPKNLWPTEDKMPEFERSAKEFGLLLKRVTVDLSRHLDAYLQSKVKSYKAGALYNAMKDTEKVKCRLLYYYPKTDESGSNNSSWIGWHNDSGFLTALAGDYYLDHSTGKLCESCPDDEAGLYVADRQDNPRRVILPSDCLAIQLGECTQILAGGAVYATPHWVKAASAENIARISLAAFVDTPPGFQLLTPPGTSRESVCDSSLQSKRVPPLIERFTEDGMTFGKFLETTFNKYYEWNK